MLLACFNKAQAQSVEERGLLGDVRPLEIGDTIPEELWNIPLKVINHPDGKDWMVLKDHKSKVIIIDFWSTYCGACIGGFPKLIDLQKKYGDKILFLPVTYQTGNDIKKTITTNTYFEGLQNSIVVGDSLLHKYFRHLTIPHVVWIDPTGKVQGFTTAHHVISGHIDELLSGTKSHWATKIEDADLLNSPLVSVKGNDLGIKVISVHPTQYSFVKGFQPGLPLYNMAVNQNKEEGTKMVRYANHAIFSLYMRALNRFANPVYESLLVFENVDPKTVKYYPNTALSADDWHEKFSVSYEAQLPESISAKDAGKRLLKDLNFYLDMDVRYADREMDTWALKIIDTTIFNNKAKSKGGARIEKLLTVDQEKILQNNSLEKLISALNYLGAPCPVVNQTNYEGGIDLYLVLGDILNIEQLNDALKRYGLSMVTEKNNVKVLVIESLADKKTGE